MSAPRRTAAILALSALALIAAPTASAASQETECGQYVTYTAPDPLGPTDGSLQLGLLPAWAIAADATLTAPVDTTMPNQLSGNVTCVTIDFDDGGIITGLAVASQGTISGLVTFDSGSSTYLFDDRLQLPTFVTDLYPGLRALFHTSADAGTTLIVTFHVDPSTGTLTSLTGDAGFCGKAGIDGDGNGTVGDATIPVEVLDADDVDLLDSAGARDACASVHADGTLDPNTGELTLDTDVTIDLDAPTAPPTSTSPGGGTGQLRPDAGWLWLVLLTSVVVVLLRPGRARARTNDR